MGLASRQNGLTASGRSFVAALLRMTGALRDTVILSAAKDLGYAGTRFFASLRMTSALRDTVILSAAKDLGYAGTRFFASLRMTSACLILSS